MLFEIYNNKKEQINSHVYLINELEKKITTTINMQDKFFAHDLITDELYIRKKSRYLAKYFSNKKQTLQLFNDIDKKNNIISYDNSSKFKNAYQSFTDICDSFEQAVKLILRRGYKDHGIEGAMRSSIHKLMNDRSLEKWNKHLLSLRRHEKDFIIRSEEKYAILLNLEYMVLYNTWYKNRINAEHINLLISYKNNFDSIVIIDNIIGLKLNKGLRYSILKKTQFLEKLFNSIILDVNKNTYTKLYKYKIIFRLLMIILFLVSLFGAIFLSKYVTRPIENLTGYITEYLNSNYEKITIPKNSGKKDEISTLSTNLLLMQKEITVHFRNYKLESEKRKRELLIEKAKVEFQKIEIENQYQKVNLYNKNILDSIRYAKRIQTYLLPTQDKCRALLKNYFVIFQPKDIVSGDFYWVECIHDKIYIAVADCTGHGVPGAFMSILGNTLLDQAVFEKKLTQPDEILNFLNSRLSDRFKQNGINSEFKDGMDIAFIMIDKTNQTISFSGAQRPMIYINNKNSIEVIKGDKRPIGWIADSEMHIFRKHTIELKDIKELYLFTDGYYDQFGGNKKKKFKFKNFLNLLSSIATKSYESKKDILLESFNKWKKEEDQLDDVTVFSIKMSSHHTFEYTNHINDIQNQTFEVSHGLHS